MLISWLFLFLKLRGKRQQGLFVCYLSFSSLVLLFDKCFHVVFQASGLSWHLGVLWAFWAGHFYSWDNNKIQTNLNIPGCYIHVSPAFKSWFSLQLNNMSIWLPWKWFIDTCAICTLQAALKGFSFFFLRLITLTCTTYCRQALKLILQRRINNSSKTQDVKSLCVLLNSELWHHARPYTATTCDAYTGRGHRSYSC